MAFNAGVAGRGLDSRSFWIRTDKRASTDGTTSSGLSTTGRERDFFGTGIHVVEDPPLPQGDPIEEAEGRHGDDQRARRKTALVGQVDLVGADLLQTETRRRAAEVAGEPRHRGPSTSRPAVSTSAARTEPTQ